ncbi:MAG: BNR-4 repeat-containing protein [Clostridia bacterium]|nr:BNR-4 repeat-containing protein [Clostridia bacterium]
MILTDRAKEVRIKRANTDWWINEKAVVGANGLTYIAYVTDMGEIHVKELDAKCSRALSHDVRVCRMNCTYADEHNAPSLCILENGRIMVTYTGHAQTHTLSYRITEKPYDITSFGKEHVLTYENNVTYAQVFENTKRHEIWMFARVKSVTWEFRFSKDEGATWSEPTTFLKSDAGGLFYFDVRKQLIPTASGTGEQWFFALYGHPRISKDHTVRSGVFDADGWLLTCDGKRTEVNLFGKGKSEIELEKLETVYESPEGTTVRLLAVSPVMPYRIGLAAFTLDNADSIVYYAAEYGGGKWVLSEPVAKAGDFLAPNQTDGSQTYVGGMAFYYGAGEAGFNPADGGVIDTNRIYLSRADGEFWYLESYVSHDCGKSYKLEQTIRKISKSENIKIWRPTVPIYAQDNLPVYWHEGSYSAHTGGWHCDAVMLVEYDD